MKFAEDHIMNTIIIWRISLDILQILSIFQFHYLIIIKPILFFEYY
jgi:hypothetical protein